MKNSEFDLLIRSCNFTIEQYIEMDYRDLENLICNLCDLEEFSLVESLEARNDTAHTFDCTENWLNRNYRTNDMLNDEMEEYQEWRSGNDLSGGLIYSILNLAAYFNLIPKATYLVNISW